jgi:preprotein translocase subunit Sss1
VRQSKSEERATGTAVLTEARKMIKTGAKEQKKRMLRACKKPSEIYISQL